VPHHFRNEANLLKVETSGAKSRKSMGADREATPGYVPPRKKGKKRRDSFDEDEDLMEDMVEDGVTAEEMMGGDEVMEAMNNGDITEGGELEASTPGVTGTSTPEGEDGSTPECHESQSGRGSGAFAIASMGSPSPSQN